MYHTNILQNVIRDFKLISVLLVCCLFATFIWLFSLHFRIKLFFVFSLPFKKKLIEDIEQMNSIWKNNKLTNTETHFQHQRLKHKIVHKIHVQMYLSTNLFSLRNHLLLNITQADFPFDSILATSYIAMLSHIFIIKFNFLTACDNDLNFTIRFVLNTYEDNIHYILWGKDIKKRHNFVPYQIISVFCCY